MDLIKYELFFNKKFENLKRKFNDYNFKLKHEIFLVIFTKRNNNIFITLTTLNNNIIFKTSSGFEGFKNSIKSSPFILQYICQNFVRRILKLKIYNLIFKFNGVSKNFIHFLKIFKKPIKFFTDTDLAEMSLKIRLLQIINKPKIKFGGCKLRKQKRR
jgi:ribosomal protein S11